MTNPSGEQPSVAGVETGVDGLLNAHRAIATAWFSNWRAQQQERIEQVVQSRSHSEPERGSGSY